MAAYAKPQKRKKEKSAKLRGEGGRTRSMTLDFKGGKL